MIVRVLSAQVPAAFTSAVHAHIRDQWLPELRGKPGLAYLKLARRAYPDGERLILISEWRTVADLYRWAGDNIEQLRLPEGDESPALAWVVEHYEALDVLPPDTPDAPNPTS